MMVDKETILDVLDFRDKAKEFWVKKGLLHHAKEKVQTEWRGHRITNEKVIELLSYIVEQLQLPVKDEFTDADLFNIADYLEQEYHCEYECDVDNCDSGLRYVLTFANDSYIIKHTICPKWFKKNYLIPALKTVLGEANLDKLVSKMGVNNLEEVNTLELMKIYTYATGRH